MKYVSAMDINRRQFLGLLSASVGATLVPGVFGLPEAMAAPLLPNHPLTFYSPQDLQKIKIGIYFSRRDMALRIYEGLRKHGLDVSFITKENYQDVGMYVIGGWRARRIIREAQEKKKNILVIEGGFIQPRKAWRSLGFNGLNGYAMYAPAADNGERFQKRHGYHLKPWRQGKDGYALLIGQVPGDKSLHGVGINRWLRVMAEQLKAKNIEVLYRPHPRVATSAENWGEDVVVPEGVRLSSGTLAEDLAGAAYTVIYSSTTAVESVLAGVPAVVMSPGSIAWPVTSHDLDSPLLYPDRTQWCNDLAWRQWTEDEIRDGSAWEHTKRAILR